MLADLVAEFAKSPEEVEMGNGSVNERSIGVASIQGLRPWELYVDRAANQRGSGVGLVLVEGKSGFVSHTKLTAEATFMDLFHYN